MIDEALLKQSKIARLGAPAAYDLKFLRGWWRRPRMGNFPLVGLDRFSYMEQYERDLVALKTRSVPDPFSRWFTHHLLFRWSRSVGNKVKVPCHSAFVTPFTRRMSS